MKGQNKLFRLNNIKHIVVEHRSLPVLPPPITTPPQKKSHLSNLSFSARTLAEGLDDSRSIRIFW